MGRIRSLLLALRSYGLRAAQVLPWPFRPREAIPTLVSHRDQKSQVALIFLHGFSGDTVATWGRFVEFILAEPSITSWDVYSLGYPSSLRIDVPNVWAADPGIALLSQELRTTLSLDHFARYKRIAIAAHSMGGLVVQRALVDDAILTARTSHVFLFGTPSAGLPKARFVSMLKRQFRDMVSDSAFIQSLRASWKTLFANAQPFQLIVVAGDRDEFVPSSSSLVPFGNEVRAVVSGNHVEIVKPRDKDHGGVRLIVQALSGGSRSRGAIDGARLAVELDEFRMAVERLLPLAESLDDAALSSLALALDGLGRGAEALQLLEQQYRGSGISSTDALGILAGRIKRRWLAERRAVDLSRARELYITGLQQAEAESDHEQAYYHAINVAFLGLLASPANSKISPEVFEMAQRALVHCQSSDENHWRLATEAEANLILGNLEIGIERYKRAILRTSSPRDVDSMYSQAVRVAARRFGEDGIQRIAEVFDVPIERPQ